MEKLSSKNFVVQRHMYKKDFIFILFFSVATLFIFFSKVVFLHQIPFPGDLLIDTSPFKTESYLGYMPGGYPNKAQGRDVITQSYPWRLFSITQLKKGQLPLWNPYNFSGNAHIGNYQSGVFYPLETIFFFLPFISSWTVFIVIQPLLAMIFMYLFLRSLKSSRLPSLIGSIAFGYSSYMVVWLEYGNIGHTFLWLPLMLFAIGGWIHTQKIKYSILLCIAGAMCLLAGYIQGAFYVFGVTLLYGLFLCFNDSKRIKKIGIFLLSFAFSIGLGAMQVLPSLQIFSESTRGVYTQLQIHDLLQPWYYLITIFSSDFFGNPATRNFYLPITYFERVMYVGIPIIFFAMIALKNVKNFQVKFFGILALISLVITTDFPGISWFYSLPIPMISTTVPTRFLSIFMFSIIVLSTYGIHYWLSTKNPQKIVLSIFSGIYLLVWIELLIVPKLYPEVLTNLSITKHTFLFSTIIAFLTVGIFFLRNVSTKLSKILLVVLVIVDLLYVFIKFTPFSPVQLVYPTTSSVSYMQQHQGIYRSWGYGSAYIAANYQTALGIYAADGYDALHNKDYNRLLNSSATGKIQLPLSRGDANIAPATGFVQLTENPYRKKILDLLGVKYILHLPYSGNTSLAEKGVFPEEHYALMWHDKTSQIYENLDVFPRFFLVDKYVVANSSSEIEQIYQQDLRHTIILDKNPHISFLSANGAVKLISYQPNKIIFYVTTPGNTLLFLTDTYDKGWKAKIDGKATEIYRADVAFRAVIVPEGKHEIIFSYEPFSFVLGAWISGGSLIVLLLLWGVRRRISSA